MLLTCLHQTIEPASNTQVLASEEYRRSKRLSIYLSMPTEVDTHHILEVYTLKRKSVIFIVYSSLQGCSEIRKVSKFSLRL